MAMENFSWLLLGDGNEPITNANPLPTITIRRLSDNHIFDWNDNVFKSSGWIVKKKDLVEFDSVSFAGTYETSLDLSSFLGKYVAYVDYLGTDEQHTSNEFNVIDGAVSGLATGLTLAQEAKIDAIPTTDNVADLTGVLSAISAIPTVDTVTGTNDILTSISELNNLTAEDVWSYRRT